MFELVENVFGILLIVMMVVIGLLMIVGAISLVASIFDDLFS